VLESHPRAPGGQFVDPVRKIRERDARSRDAIKLQVAPDRHAEIVRDLRWVRARAVILENRLELGQRKAVAAELRGILASDGENALREGMVNKETRRSRSSNSVRGVESFMKWTGPRVLASV